MLFSPLLLISSGHRRIVREANDLLDYVFVIVTAAIAYHGITYRTEDGETESVHLLFGAIALLFCIRVLFVDIFKLV